MASKKDFSLPWAIKEEVLHSLASEAGDRAGRAPQNADEMAALQKRVEQRKEGFSTYSVVNGVAVIPVKGVLMKDPDFWDRYVLGAASLTDIKAMVEAAAEDPAVSSIALDIDSPGGTVSGTAEAADAVFAARKKKPVYAFSAGMMASGAYWLGSAAEKVYATRTTAVGSIGVYMALWDLSVAAHNAGIKVEIIRAGKFKGMGHPLKGLTENEREELQKHVENLRELFVTAVAIHRDMSMQVAQKLADGRDWLAAEAKELGLIDDIGSMDSVLFSGSKEKVSASAGAGGVKASTESVAAEANHTTEKKETAQMADFKDMKLEEMRAGRPDLAAALIAEGREAGVTEGRADAERETKGKQEAEKARVSGIFAKAAEIKDVPLASVQAAIEGGESVEVAENRMKAAKLDAMNGSHPKPMGAGNDAEERARKAQDHLARAKEHQAKHGGTLELALQATAEPVNSARATKR